MLTRRNNPDPAGPKVCRNCGAIVGAGEPQCGVCGAPVANQSQQRRGPDPETLSFARAILNRPYKFTIILLIANLFVFLLMWQASGLTSPTLWIFPDTVLVAYGAKLNWLINQKHEWWRFVTPMFVHVGLLHLLVNMYSLWAVGPYVEKLYGSARFVTFWVLTGIAGVVASYLTVRPNLAGGPIARFLFKPGDVPSAGASGALFGLVGVLFIFGIKFRHELPEGFKRAFGTGMLPIILINLFIGYIGRGLIDNAAHLGGFAAGALLALAVDYRRPDQKAMMTTSWRILQVAMLVLVAISFIQTARHRDQPPFIANTAAPTATDARADQFVAYAKAMNDGQDAFFLAFKNNDTSQADGAIKELESAPSIDPTADKVRTDLKDLVIKAKEFANPPAKSSELQKQTAQRELANEFATWSKMYQQWLKTSGRSYGLIETAASPE